MRVCTVIATGRIIEAQSNDAAGFESLLANALAAGYTAEQVAFSVMSEAAVTEAIRLQDTRYPRTLASIYADLQALSNANKAAVWGDLSGGSPKKYLAGLGGNTAAIGALDWAATESGATGHALTAARLRIAAMYCQDHPAYLVNPAFAPAVNVPGDEPAS